MLTRNKIWEDLTQIVAAEGCTLFDVEMPSSNNGTLRIYISKQGGVNVDDCTNVTKRINEHEKLSEITDEYSLEVSSPGVNRKLTSVEHYQTAIGERIKIAVKASNPSSFIGKLLTCQDNCIELEDEADQAVKKFDITQISKARVEFKF